MTTSAWWVVAGLVLVGILIALLVNRWLNGGRAVAELRWRLLGAEALVDRRNPHNADRLFAEAAAKVGLPPSVRSWTVAGAVTARTRELRARLRPEFGRPTVDAAQVGTEIDDLENEVRNWPETANLVGLLRSRAGSLAVLREYLDEARGRTLDRVGPSELTFDEVKQIKAVAREAATLAGDWPGDKIFATAELAKNLDEGSPAWQRWETLRNRFAAVRTVSAAEQVRGEYEEVDAEVRGAVAVRLRTAAQATRPAAFGWARRDGAGAGDGSGNGNSSGEETGHPHRLRKRTKLTGNGSGDG
nr:hypothetical protein [Micromonospora sp. DSM 115978]